MLEHSEIVQKIRHLINNRHYTPCFSPRDWKKTYANCYAYALDLNISDKKAQVFIPGRISNQYSNGFVMSTRNLLAGVKRDLDFLGIPFRSNDNLELKEGEYRIAIYYSLDFTLSVEFHFARQDSNGNWSEKLGWEGKVKKAGKRGNTPPNFEKDNLVLLEVLILKAF